ncbi:helix-turn-helix domain-containing protein [Microbacterium amylolyticum]|uniref:Transcriptional regulator with XRE-family HTH domain n=1 Tax=Microbacterium amylolyticum TaxID=936337 RepID=A0ABS4ZG09_9MICO|nr:helix-turn-helix domain-containing protein [Microbacterium amylolyticum]MBP2436204.1 transcriptional regulator with XRE-family HTH domain [Microbacterium amylolyticum]
MANPLGDFLRARRTDAALSGASAGGARRRTPGLRREDVAIRAGISVDYYIRLEQGRETHPSDEVLAALARALELSDDAASHLRVLRLGPLPARAAAQRSEAIIERMARLVDAVRPHPAYVLDRVSGVVAASADDPEAPELAELVSELSETSEEFAQWWADHIVVRRRGAVQEIRRRDGSFAAHHYEVLHLPDSGMRMTLWLPV